MTEIVVMLMGRVLGEPEGKLEYRKANAAWYRELYKSDVRETSIESIEHNYVESKLVVKNIPMLNGYCYKYGNMLKETIYGYAQVASYYRGKRARFLLVEAGNVRAVSDLYKIASERRCDYAAY